MNKLGDIRQAADRSYEILTHIEEPGDPIYERDAMGFRYVVGYEERRETWQPAATYLIQRRALESGTTSVPISLEQALIAEGWEPPRAD